MVVWLVARGNKEVGWIFKEQIQGWFETEKEKDMRGLIVFCKAFEENDTAVIVQGFTLYLWKTISICETNSRKEVKEKFYHGILLGLFAGMEDEVQC